MISITSTIAASLTHGPHRPFGATPMIKKQAAAVYVDPNELEICNDPIPANRIFAVHKYEAKFSALQPGQALKVPKGSAMKVANSLRKWITDKKLDAHVRSVQTYPGDKAGLGRVWLMPGPQTSGRHLERKAQ